MARHPSLIASAKASIPLARAKVPIYGEGLVGTGCDNPREVLPAPEIQDSRGGNAWSWKGAESAGFCYVMSPFVPQTH
jgi:hypothetical protein